MGLCTMKNCYPPLTHLAAALLGAAVATMLLRPTQSLHVLPAGAHVLLHILRGVPVLIPHWSGGWSGQNEIDDTHCPRGPRVESRYVRLRIDSSHIRFRRSGRTRDTGGTISSATREPARARAEPPSPSNLCKTHEPCYFMARFCFFSWRGASHTAP